MNNTDNNSKSHRLYWVIEIALHIIIIAYFHAVCNFLYVYVCEKQRNFKMFSTLRYIWQCDKDLMPQTVGCGSKKYTLFISQQFCFDSKRFPSHKTMWCRALGYTWKKRTPPRARYTTRFTVLWRYLHSFHISAPYHCRDRRAFAL